MISGHRSSQDCLFTPIVLARVWRVPRADTVNVIEVTKYASVGFELDTNVRWRQHDQIIESKYLPLVYRRRNTVQCPERACVACDMCSYFRSPLDSNRAFDKPNLSQPSTVTLRHFISVAKKQIFINPREFTQGPCHASYACHTAVLAISCPHIYMQEVDGVE